LARPGAADPGHQSGDDRRRSDTRDLRLANAEYPSRVACVVDLAGDVDLRAYTLPPALDEVVALLGGTLAEVPARYRDVSPLSWIDARTVPFLVIHGLRDDVVPIEQPQRLVAALRAGGVEVEYTELPDAGHGMYSSHHESVNDELLRFFG